MNNWLMIVFRFCLNVFLGDFFFIWFIMSQTSILSCYNQNILSKYCNYTLIFYIEIEKIKTMFWFLLVISYFDEIYKYCDVTNIRWKLQINFMILWTLYESFFRGTPVFSMKGNLICLFFLQMTGLHASSPKFGFEPATQCFDLIFSPLWF